MATRDNGESAGDHAARCIARLKRFQLTKDISGVSKIPDNDGFTVVSSRYNKKPKRLQQQTHAVQQPVRYPCQQCYRVRRSLKSKHSMQPVSNRAGKLQSANESSSVTYRSSRWYDIHSATLPPRLNSAMRSMSLIKLLKSL